MVDVDKAVVARLKSGGNNYEILVNCDDAIRLKQGVSVDMVDVLATEQIFTDAAKGMLASETHMKSVFGTDDPKEIAKAIISKGEIQLTADYRKELRNKKFNQILDKIQRNGVDPKTGLPHPRTRIELAFDQIKVHVDEFGSTDKQVQDVLKKIQPILPIRFEKKQIMVTIPSEFAGKCFQPIKNYGKMLKEEWLNDGSWTAIVEIPAGLQGDFFDQLNNLTKGEVETKVLDTK